MLLLHLSFVFLLLCHLLMVCLVTYFKEKSCPFPVMKIKNKIKTLAQIKVIPSIYLCLTKVYHNWHCYFYLMICHITGEGVQIYPGPIEYHMQTACMFSSKNILYKKLLRSYRNWQVLQLWGLFLPGFVVVLVLHILDFPVPHIFVLSEIIYKLWIQKLIHNSINSAWHVLLLNIETQLI